MYGSDTDNRWSTVFRTFGALPRRQIVDSLLHAPPDREMLLPEAANSPDQRRDPSALYVELIHIHLPRMAEAGFIEWEKDPLRVWRGHNFDEVGSVMEAVQSYDEYSEPLRQECHRLEIKS